jgi:hypothetical protein
LLVLPGAARAEQFVQDGEYLVHYAALPTITLAPDIARKFGLTRSKRYALLVLNAQRGTLEKNVSITATGEGEARSLIGHVQKLALRQAREGDVHYLLAEVEALNQEFLVFDLRVLPDGATKPLLITFTQQFYSDDPTP